MKGIFENLSKISRGHRRQLDLENEQNVKYYWKTSIGEIALEIQTLPFIVTRLKLLSEKW